jgi:hypothetical protein
VQRLAKHILRQVVHRHLDGGPACRRIIDELRQAPSHVRSAIERDDPDALDAGRGGLLATQASHRSGRVRRRGWPLAWRPSRPTPRHGNSPAAGGGGFVFLISADARSMAAMRRAIRAMGERDGTVREYAWSIAKTGVRVEIR